MMNRTNWHAFMLILVICATLALPQASFASRQAVKSSFELDHQSKLARLDATPQVGTGASILITTSNVTQLQVVAQMPLEPSFALVNQIVWRQMREIEARTGYSTIWLYRPDADAAAPRFINYGGGVVGKITLSPDGRLLAATVNDPNRFKIQVIIWDVATGTIVTRLDAFGAEFSADGRYLALNGNNALIVWDMATSAVDKTLLDAGIFVDPKSIPPLTISPDSRVIASTDAAGTLGLWDVSTSQRVRTFNDQVGSPRELWFRPDGALLAARIDTRIQLWDAATGNSVAILNGHTDDVLDMSFTPDGTLLASVGTDNKVLVWEVSTGTLLTTLNIVDADRTLIRSVAFSPDGTQLAIGITPLTDKKQLGNPEIWLWAVLS
jgi:WD40 repeat protein